MMESGDFSLDNDSDKFCVSWFAIKVAAVGIELFVAHGMSIQYQVLSEIKTSTAMTDAELFTCGILPMLQCYMSPPSD